MNTEAENVYLLGIVQMISKIYYVMLLITQQMDNIISKPQQKLTLQQLITH